MSTASTGLQLETVRFKRLATGFRFTEGPVLYADDDIGFTDIFGNKVCRWHTDGRVEVLDESLERPNGMAFSAAGELLVCLGGERRLGVWRGPGAVTTLADRYEGRRLNSPNDVMAGPNGRIYFTDPPWSVAPEQRELAHAGVYVIDHVAGLQLLADRLPYPNGLALSADGATLYVSNSKPPEERALWAFDLRADGSLGAGSLLAPMLAEGRGVPDGLKVHPTGVIFCTGTGGVWLFEASGRHLGTLVAPENPANCLFSRDFKTLFLTAESSVYAAGISGLGLA
jgi:gluconolactonase